MVSLIHLLKGTKSTSSKHTTKTNIFALSTTLFCDGHTIQAYQNAHFPLLAMKEEYCSTSKEKENR